jgi:hypothetical protein
MKSPRIGSLCLAALFALLMVFPASARVVSFSVVETGLSKNRPRMDASLKWEDSLIKTFFDRGHMIISNSPLRRLEREPSGDLPPEFRAIFDAAGQDGAEFYILVVLDYRNQPLASPRPKTALVRVYRISPYELLAEEPVSGWLPPQLGDFFDRAMESRRLELISRGGAYVRPAA